MENEIIKLILNTSGMALALALLFFYALNMFKVTNKERDQLRKEINDLQLQFHNFKDEVIERLLEADCFEKKQCNEKKQVTWQ